MDEDFDLYRKDEQELVRLTAEISPESYKRQGPGLQEVGLALAERREALRESQRVQKESERALKDLERADERANNALRLIEDAL